MKPADLKPPRDYIQALLEKLASLVRIARVSATPPYHAAVAAKQPWANVQTFAIQIALAEADLALYPVGQGKRLARDDPRRHHHETDGWGNGMLPALCHLAALMERLMVRWGLLEATTDAEAPTYVMSPDELSEVEMVVVELEGMLDHVGQVEAEHEVRPAPRDVRVSSPQPRAREAGETMSAAARAIGVLYEWAKAGKRLTMAGIAREAGCDRTHLYRSPEFKAVWDMYQDEGDPPGGAKDAKTGDMEAWSRERKE